MHQKLTEENRLYEELSLISAWRPGLTEFRSGERRRRPDGGEGRCLFSWSTGTVIAMVAASEPDCLCPPSRRVLMDIFGSFGSSYKEVVQPSYKSLLQPSTESRGRGLLKLNVCLCAQDCERYIF